nr:sulfotransferase family 2 domain-containing protein [Pseudoalteromonas sp. TB64]
MHKYKCIFIHIPKNAGSSIMKMLGDSKGRFHVESGYYKQVNDFFYSRYHTFAIVREPLDRLFSAYQYSCNGGNKSVEDLVLAKLIKNNSTDFLSFIDNILDMHFIMEQPLFKPQYLYVYERGVMNVDTILYFESLEKNWSSFAEIHNLPTQLIQTNRSLLGEKIPILKNRHYEKVKQLYLPDYQLFKYKFINDC